MSASHYGTFDQAGNVHEWNEGILTFLTESWRGFRGGNWSWSVMPRRQPSVAVVPSISCGVRRKEFGFRVAAIGDLPVIPLQAGDVDQDLKFDQVDLVEVLLANRYLSGLPATWGEGDWDGAPGGAPGNPPPGNGLFDQLDIVAALAPGHYLAGPYAAVVQSVGLQGDAHLGHNVAALARGGDPGVVDLAYVPEPSALLLGSLGVLLAFAGRHRRWVK